MKLTPFAKELVTQVLNGARFTEIGYTLKLSGTSVRGKFLKAIRLTSPDIYRACREEQLYGCYASPSVTALRKRKSEITANLDREYKGKETVEHRPVDRIALAKALLKSNGIAIEK